jgi:transcription-repair coupling factor (superfamily II helicase)
MMLDRLLDTDGLRSLLDGSQPVVAVPEAARALALAGILRDAKRNHIVVAVPTTAEAERLQHDLRAFLGAHRVWGFPAWETLPFERLSPAVETMGRRLRAAWHLKHDEGEGVIVVAPIRALLQRLGPTSVDSRPRVIRRGDEIDREALVRDLVALGYRRDYQVEHRGDLAVRGSILDIYTSTGSEPTRLEFWGDEVERLNVFSVGDQRSGQETDSIEIFPCREVLATQDIADHAEKLMATEPWGREQWQRLADGESFDGMESWLPWLTPEVSLLTDHLGDEAQVVLLDPRRLRDRASDILAEEADLAVSLAKTWDVDEGSVLPSLHVEFDRLLTNDAPQVKAWQSLPDSPSTPAVEIAGWEPVHGDGALLVAQLQRLLSDEFTIVVAADGAGSAERLANSLKRQGIPVNLTQDAADLTRPGLYVIVESLERGVLIPALKLGILSERDLTGRRRSHRVARRPRQPAAGRYEDLKVGSYVVHHQHGVARYLGMVTRPIMGSERDYLQLEFKGGDKIYLPSDQIDLIRLYTGGDSPSLSKMGGAEWTKAKAKVRSAVQEVAQELVVLYQKRLASVGHAFAPDSAWQHELESSFPFQETPDQLKAIVDVKQDMEEPTPMDRLVCGDVGFGKTEIAIRAVFKAVQDGKQTAVLVPTTLLASQHHQTFGERFAGYPVRVEVLSRFLTSAQQRKVIAAVADGDVDVLIGTHRLLGKDVKFKDLGLLVVDEEQRFGVGHKESIKQLRADVDVLTLTATPIPRTLELSLTGIRDMTLLQTPPAERQPILTYVGEYNDRAVAEAIRRELLREGQLFFVHNRVKDIERIAEGLRALVPEARIAVAHGQMDEGSLETIVYEFWEGEYDVLVCTTIIESGIDMPTVNTLVVDRADLLGLGQLHQLRGRVGRAGQRAYAYLFHPVDRVLSEEAYERLKVIGEATELGSGFRIAMRDLEIRGAGNLLNASQSGHISAVGYDLYCQMVSEAVSELKGEKPKRPAEVKIDLPIVAFLPDGYVAREDLRLEGYRRLAGVTTFSQVEDIRAEWLDRFGPIPTEAKALLKVARLRAACFEVGVQELSVLRKTLLRLSPVELPTSRQMRLSRLFRGAVYKDEQGELQVPVPRSSDAQEIAEMVFRELFDVLVGTENDD